MGIGPSNVSGIVDEIEDDGAAGEALFCTFMDRVFQLVPPSIEKREVMEPVTDAASNLTVHEL